MSKPLTERLYNLLPAIYRIRDSEKGEPLRALLAVIENELQAIENDIDGLYRNWFIETCDEWVVPYIGDLLGVRGLHTIDPKIFSLRPYVANTIAYRRRKSTAAVLEQIAKDVTGWSARVVEFFQLLSVTQHLNHVILSQGKTLDLRDANKLELVGSPFECTAHTGEVRRIAKGRGRYNIPNIGIFLWRLQSYTVTRRTARPVSEPADGCYTFNPLGYDVPLFNQPETEIEITHLAEENNIRCALRRRPLYKELEARRQAIVNNQMPQSIYFGDKPVLEIFIQRTSNNKLKKLPPEEIVICNLSNWRRPTSKTFIRPDGTTFMTSAAVDPVLGRLAFLNSVKPYRVEVSKPYRVEVSYAYGFSGDVGGGPYNRTDSVEKWYDPEDPNQKVTWQIGVKKDYKTLSEAQDKTQLVQTLQDAIKAWNDYVAAAPKKAFGIIAIMDSSTYKENLTGKYCIEVPASSKLAIVAANWPEVDKPNSPGQKERKLGQLVPDGYHSHLSGNLSVRGTAQGEYLFSWGEIPGNDSGRFKEFLTQKFGIDWIKAAAIEKIDDGKTIRVTNGKNFLSLRLNEKKTKANLEIDDFRTDEFIVKIENGKLNIYQGDSSNPGELILDGLLVEGKLTVLAGNLGKLLLAHCTLVPDKGGILVNSSSVQKGMQNAHLHISIYRSICGAIAHERTSLSIMLELSIVDSIVDQANGEAIKTSTKVPSINADIQTSTIFGSTTMRSLEASSSIFTGVVNVARQQDGCVRFSYVPDHSLTPRRYRCQPDLSLKDVTDPNKKDSIRARLKPSFTSTKYGDPAYAQLSLTCAKEIRTGAEDSSEMGVFNNLKQPQREAILRTSIEEYLRFGLEAGIFYVI